MKIHIANKSNQSLGGGWTFLNNFVNGANSVKDVEFVGITDKADIGFIPSASMIDREYFKTLKQNCKKVVLRVDNALKNSRNRGSGMIRMKEFSKQSDLIVFQSSWSHEYLGDFLEVDDRYAIIMNGVDKNIFRKKGSKIDYKEDIIYLYSRFNKDESKMWVKTLYEFQYLHSLYKKRNMEVKLLLVGRFSRDLIKYNFDFFNGENYEYLGIIQDSYRMAEIYRSVDYVFANYYNDACSNTLIEARACGCDFYLENGIHIPNMENEKYNDESLDLVYKHATGGTTNILSNHTSILNIDEMFSLYYYYFEGLIK